MSQEKPLVGRPELRPIQWGNLRTLQKNFTLSDSELGRCLFFRKEQDEPWIPPDILQGIARLSGQFRLAGIVDHPHFNEMLNQVSVKANVIDWDGREFPNIGVATIGEKPDGENPIDFNILACSRAIGGALTAAGFNPFKAGSVAAAKVKEYEFTGKPLTDHQKELHQIEHESAQRKKDIAQIHVTAVEKGLILKLPSGGERMDGYRDWLFEVTSSWGKGVRSAAVLDAEQRKRVINKLNDYSQGNEFIYRMPADLQEDALIA